MLVIVIVLSNHVWITKLSPEGKKIINYEIRHTASDNHLQITLQHINRSVCPNTDTIGYN